MSLIRVKHPGEAWSSSDESVALPDWWDATADSVEFSGSVTITPGDPDVANVLDLVSPEGGKSNAQNFLAFHNEDGRVGYFDAGGNAEWIVDAPGGAEFQVSVGTILAPGSSAVMRIGSPNGTVGGIGFFGTSPAAKPTGVAVTAGGIHAALVSLGLIAA